jgi:uncharacterized protein YjbI with pentapeptide repeats
LRACNLAGRHIEVDSLLQADLEGADLTGADLTGVRLRQANLRHARLQCADLQDADLTGADLSGATYDHRTRWPPSFDPQRRGAVRADRSMAGE